MKLHHTLFPVRVLLPLLAVLALCASSCYVPAQSEQEQTVVVQNYVPPPWAPPYDNTSEIRYYYLPDYEVYYDVWGHQFWYLNDGGDWVESFGPPPPCAGADLNGAFIVLIDRDIDRPWQHHTYYRDNYPRHGYDHYTDIVVHNRIVTNTEPGHELVPRAFNENTNRVTFMQRSTVPPPPTPPAMGGRPGEGNMPPPPTPPPPPALYHHVVHEVPMHQITPSMPVESQNHNYGGGYSKSRAPQPGTMQQSAPQARAPQARAPQSQAPKSPAPKN